MTASEITLTAHTTFVAKPYLSGKLDPETVRLTGKKVKKVNRFNGFEYFHLQIEAVDGSTPGKVVSGSQSDIKVQYRCQCGKAAFHKGWNN